MEAGTPQAKAALRDQVRARLRALSPIQRATASNALCARLKPQVLRQFARSILFFAPLPGEPDIWPLFEQALAAGKTAALPRFSSASQTYGAARVQDLQNDLRRGRFGIREPTAA